MEGNWFFWLFIGLFIFCETWEGILIQLNKSYLLKHAHQIPEDFRQKISPKEYKKSIQYNKDRLNFGTSSQILGILAFLFVLFSGAFHKMDTWLTGLFHLNGIHHSVLYCVIIGFFVFLLQIPISLYSQFIIEQKHGFNKMSFKLFLIDSLKGLLLSGCLGIPLLYLVFWLYQQSGDYWWVYALGVIFGFQLLMAAIYPTWIAPIFNKFTPLPEGSLKDSILTIANRVNFRLSGIYTIDGSRRSSHSNAYFSGIGKFRKIVLFDTLVQQMNERQILSVLAHEMGHNQKRHIQKQLILSFILTALSFWILSKWIEWPYFYDAFRAGDPAPHKALVLFSLSFGYFSFFITPLTHFLSRKYEYEADRFSVETTQDSASMISALITLSNQNLSNLTPHPLYSFYHYTHPTTLERIQALKQ